MSPSLIRSTSPQRPTEILGEWTSLGPRGVATAVNVAVAAARQWSGLGSIARGAYLRRAADRMESDSPNLVDVMAREVGKPIVEAEAEVARAVAILRFQAQAVFDADGETYPAPGAHAWLTTRRVPLGVVGLITPWNFPVAIPIWKLAPALACGNVVLLKPARQALATAHRLVDCFDLPTGVLQILNTDETGARSLALHPDVAGLSFTGSVEVGRKLARQAARRMIPLQAEMGGVNASIVLGDADVVFAARVIATAAMSFAGQKCTATSRVIVVGDPTAFLEAFVGAIAAMDVGDPLMRSTAIGPVISDRARARVLDGVRDARGRGGRVVLGGRPLSRDGHFVEPTVVSVQDESAAIVREEFFGPICAVVSVPTVDEAIERANATPYGLVAAAFTGDLTHAMRLAVDLEAGLVRINAPTTGVDFHVPFGGSKASSLGPREQGRAARDFYSSTVSVTVAPPQ